MYYGFDIGGTKIEFGAFDENLERVLRRRISTPTNNYNELVEALAGMIEAADAELACKGLIGIGIPGMEDANTGKLLTPNIPATTGRTLRKDLEARIGGSVSIENDANCFALSEAWASDLRTEDSVLGLIHGTGFGGGLVIKGKIHRGLNNIAGEFGHTQIPINAWLHLGGEKTPLFTCGCGKKGCLDEYLSGRGFEQIYAHFYGDQVDSVALINRYEQRERKATEHVERYLELMAICYANLFTAIDPGVVVLGGGLSNFDLIYSEIVRRLPDHLLGVAKVPKIKKARYGDAGGVRGAAFLNISAQYLEGTVIAL
ncbi:N-acetylglucosamine kinase [Brenneria tiliae]|uniref:N-acetyl-D-glucosamine kinase n=1 Tax=Brenneria tiliae TaxID=2914984 RepID=A0ABT0MYY9_9GAMM|nr:N-acetylglucosamine kinase [Brenneria tiliae]MCL2895055.1 N-acetylglucosamine kinase [Brenneria tiliae]